MNKKFFKVIMFISSYVPLYIVLILKEILQKYLKLKADVIQFKLSNIYISEFDDIVIIILSIISFLSILVLIVTVKKSLKTTQEEYRVISIENKTANYYFSYVGLYFLPCVGMTIGNIVDCFILLAIMIIIGFVYVSNDLIYINPVLILFGYRVYAITINKVNASKNIEINKIAITKCKEPKLLIDNEVEVVVSDTKYTIIMKK